MNEAADTKDPAVPPADSSSRLREENAALRMAVKARDDFISIAAHELRNPMTPLLGQISLLRKNVSKAGNTVPPGIARGIERLDMIVRRYMRRTTALLDIARLTSGKFRLNLAMIDASASNRRGGGGLHVVRRNRRLATLRFERTGHPGLFDRTALEEIAENLISNAIKYGRGQPISVQLVSGENELWLRVEDRGLGISVENQDRIFQQFERLMTGHSTTGFGLGLWVVGQLVAAMGGRIEIESRPGQGSTFTVRLPLHKVLGKS